MGLVSDIIGSSEIIYRCREERIWQRIIYYRRETSTAYLIIIGFRHNISS